MMITDDQRNALITAAREVRQHAHAPYSHYAVGAAIMTEQGRIVTGANVESVICSLSICAERAAIFTAISSGSRRFIAAAVCTENAGSPCGACRQLLSEFAEDIPLYLVDTQGNMRETSLYALLPDGFGWEHLT